MSSSATGVFSVGTDQIDLRLLALRTPTAPAVKKMALSLKKRGQLTPVILCEDGQRPILVDGFKRLAAAQRLGLDCLKASSLSIDPIQAKAMMYLMNRAGGFSVLQEALLIRELVDTDGLSQTEAAGLLERHKSWVSRRLLMIRRLAPEIIEELKVELLPPGSAPALARVAACNQADLSAAIQLHGLSPREIRTLVALWCKATDPGTKQFLLRSSREALDVIKEEQSGLWPLQNILQRIRKHLQTVANRLQARRADLNQETMVELKKSLHQVNSGLSAIEQVLSKEDR